MSHLNNNNLKWSFNESLNGICLRLSQHKITRFTDYYCDYLSPKKLVYNNTFFALLLMKC